ncbi:MAG: hypothetical protein DRI61_15640 [Chloroflexi bacterium]|nr:MAG: hypothetical protein DRI61_15640 [Chloroflexota bacterium]HDN79571.1 hypothetical protein [Chloroflexota bacterium]
MKLFKKLGELLTTPSREEEGFWIYVECAKCGEKIKTRIDPRYDLTPLYEEKGVTGYYVRKVLIGSKGHCFEPIEVKLTFSSDRRLVKKEISGGRFISPEEFEE